MPTVTRPKMSTGATAPVSAAPSSAPASAGSITVQDSNGRSLTFRKLTTLQRLDLMEGLGASVTENLAVIAQYTVAAMLTHINGVEVDPGVTKQNLRFRLQQLGDEGLEASSEAAEALLGEGKEAVEATAKKSQEIPS